MGKPLLLGGGGWLDVGEVPASEPPDELELELELELGLELGLELELELAPSSPLGLPKRGVSQCRSL